MITILASYVIINLIMYSAEKIFFPIFCVCVIVKYCQGDIYANSSYVRVFRQINSNGCVLPQHPVHGQWTIYKPISELPPGQLAPLDTILQVSCKENYKLNGDATLVCIHGNWTTTIGQCLQTCPSIQNTAFMRVTCTHNNRKLDSCREVVDGTIARFQCADFYEDQGLERNPVHICFNGKWSNSLPECAPICGQKSIQRDPTLIVGGSNVTKGDYPWQVALYNITDKNLICGGSLLNQRVVLTAAHCITDENGKLQSREFFMVAVGKYFRQYDDNRDFNEAQFSPIYEMYIPKQYKGDTQNYFGDIALLVTRKTFVLSVRVQPVCVDWGFTYHHALLDPTRTIHGYVSGWGYTVQHKNPSDVLKELKVPLITEEQCTKTLPEDYARFITDDKLCAGYLDSDTAVCKGDSGGGLVTKHKNRYYIVAVVSLSPQAPTAEGGCDSQQYALYTRVSYYTETFILEKEARFRPSAFGNVDCEDDPNCKAVVETLTTTSTTTTTTEKPATESLKDKCILPEHPRFGRWSMFQANFSVSPGKPVSPGTILQVYCNTGYKLNGIENILCENGKWAAEIGQCLLPCPPIKSTETLEITCSFPDKETKDCSNPLEGTIARHKCAPFYDLLGQSPVRICRNGSWDLAKPECVPICGLKSVTAQPLIINGVTVKKGEYPWQVAIYRGSQKQFICSGALISQKLIITAAHCVTHENGRLQPKEYYTVAVGKLYKRYYDSLDNEAQISVLQNMFIPLEYAGEKTNFLANIAVLVAKQSFILSSRVQPVCVDWGHKYDNQKITRNSSGYVSGWGYTTGSTKLSNNLLHLEVPIISNADCSQQLPEDYRPYLKNDNFCAGSLNKTSSVRTLCLDDSGGALVTKHESRYYITGITSHSPAPQLPGRECDTQQFSFYTKVSHYTGFILEKEAQIKSSPSIGSQCRNNCPSTTTTTTKTTPKPASVPEAQKAGCTLPHHPDFGSWTIRGISSFNFSSGMSVDLGTVLQIGCYQSYKLEGDSVILCQNGKWSSSIGNCLKKCPSVYSSPNLKVTCITKGKESENCTEPTDGTRVKYECTPYYEDLQLSQNPIHVCQNGTWDRKKPQCVPVCGQKSVTPQMLIINGDTAKKGDYPWNVAIYRGTRKEFICSGSLISQRLILTSAECVTNNEGELNSKDLYTVAAGKYYRKFNDSREKTSDVQFLTLHRIFVPFQYKEYFTANIAVLVTSKPLTLSQRIQPVCVDWDLNYDGELLKPNNNLTGYVPGWGSITANEKPADELQELQVPIITDHKCKPEIPSGFSIYFTSEKFCAGYRNKSKAVCRADSGRGLVVKFNRRYYITGIVDTLVTTAGRCDSQQYTLYTRVSKFITNFILQKATQYK